MKRIIALTLGFLIAFTSVPTVSFAGVKQLYDYDGSDNIARQSDGNGTYVGIDAQISEEGNSGNNKPTYSLTNSANGTFGIDADNGKVYIADATLLTQDNELITIKIKVKKKNQSYQKEFGINVNPEGINNDQDSDIDQQSGEYSVVHGDVDTIYVSDQGSFYLVF